METNTLPCPVYAISLSRRTDRRAWIAEHLRQAGMACVFFDATDARTLHNEPLVRLYDPVRFAQHQPGERPVRDQALACTLSHYRLWRQVADAGTDWTLVLEDDARFTCAQPIPLLREIMAAAGANDVVLLNSRCRSVYFRERVSFSPRPYSMYHINGETYLAAGYLLSRGAARRLADAVERDGIIRIVDWWHRRYGADWSYLAPIRVVKPDPVTQDSRLGSDIANSDHYFAWTHDDAHRATPIFAGLIKDPRNPCHWPLYLSRLVRRIYAYYAIPPHCWK